MRSGLDEQSRQNRLVLVADARNSRARDAQRTPPLLTTGPV
jgi:hypothetical protein